MVDLTVPRGEQTPTSEQELPDSTPPAMASLPGKKERRNPSITPQKFRRFFTPRLRATAPIPLELGSRNPRDALQDITGGEATKRNLPAPVIRPECSTPHRENFLQVCTRAEKRRKLNHDPEAFKAEFGVNVPDLDAIYGPETDTQYSPCERGALIVDSLNAEQLTEVQQPPKPIKRRTEVGLAAQILGMSIGSATRTSRQYDSYPVNDWRIQTASFYSSPDDVHNMADNIGPQRIIPFCTASCNKNSLTAVGDEEGRIRLLETDPYGKVPFQNIFLKFQVHTNAIIDMVFSEDDMLLATASGDQTARIVDVLTQKTVTILGNHSASLKQVRFQPGVNSNSVLATSGRDGSVQIWDLRCKGTDGPMQDFVAKEPRGPVATSSPSKSTWARAVTTIWDAHRYPSWTSTAHEPKDYSYSGGPGKTGESVTAITFLAQENILATSSQGNASIRLWDLRNLHNQRKTQTPLSQTCQPIHHTKFRGFGISSLSLGGDGSRLYSLCKDNTVYVYSTAHLILGHAPELAQNKPTSRFSPKQAKHGLGPLYGFRHPQLRATTFYVKTAIRKPANGNTELLAVGSSDSTPILFPTDERYFGKSEEVAEPPPTAPEYTQPPIYGTTAATRERSKQDTESPRRKPSFLPISTYGTALIRGHTREVSSLSWTAKGELVTLGDDFLVRCWREDGARARELRKGGETGGRRWNSGWAGVSEDYDEDDSE